MTSQAPRIVVGVDGSGRADGAVRAAYHLARRIDATVELLHVAEVPHPLWQHLGEDDLREARERSVARLAPLVADLGVFPEQVREALEVRPGVPARELSAASEGAAWVFVGAHHREGPLDFGNNLRGLLAGARCPVWVQPDAFTGVARVRAASDLSERAPRVLAAARDVALALRVPVGIAHVFTRPDLGYVLGYPVPFPESVVTQARKTAEEGLERSSRAIDWCGIEPTTDLLEGDAATELIGLQAPDQVLVLGAHGHTGLLEAILGSVARRVLAEARAPLVLVRDD
ncbi:MAG TPA: universal stress protein [Planctomycetota bacterium]|nr:universal stress protein [Planctomycetota bacterium]